MKYEMDIEISLPRETVVKLFEDSDSLTQWMPGLVEVKQLSGKRGHPGAKAEYTHKMGRKTIKMIETITERDLPHRYSGVYTAKGCLNLVENELEEIGPAQTKWTIRTEFQCTGFLWLMAKLMPSGFKKQTRLYMNSFKEFAENPEKTESR